MGVTQRIEHDKKTLFVTAEGPVTFRDVRNHLFRERYSHCGAYAEFIDARMARPQFSSNEVRAIVSLLRVYAKKKSLGPTAVVVGTETGFGVMRMFERLVDDICAVRTFREVEVALQWLRETIGKKS